MWLVTVRVEVAVYHGWSRCRDVMCKEPGLGNELNIHKIYDLGKQVMGGHRTSLFRFRLGRTALPQHSLYCHLVLNSAAFAFKFELHGNGDMAATSYFFVTTLSFQLYTPCLGLLNLVITRRALHVYVKCYFLHKISTGTGNAIQGLKSEVCSLMKSASRELSRV